MTPGRDITQTLQRLDRLIWTLTAAVAAAVLAAPLFSTFAIEWRSFAAPAAATVVLVGLAWFYGRVRPDARLASGLQNTAQVIAFAAVGAPLSYLVASADLPLRDHIFAAADRGFGFDWRALLAWMNAYPVSHRILAPIYLSLTVQMTTAVLCLAFTGRLLRLRVYTLSFVLAALVTIAISGLLPAEGAWPYYGMTAADSPRFTPAVATTWLPVFEGLRDGSFRALTGVGAEGIIPFPSLHAALAVILMLALWPVRIVGWAALLVNLIMVAATPIEGSHYFIDVMAGIVVAVSCFAAAGRIASLIEQPVAAATAAMIPGFAGE